MIGYSTLQACNGFSPTVNADDRIAYAPLTPQEPHSLNILCGTSQRTQLIVDTRGHGCVLFDVYVAQGPAQRAQGLMHIETMDRHEGMIFLYPQEGRISMWMKNTLISLDMLFIDKESKVAHLHAGAVPLSETIIDSGADVVAVIELNAGSINDFGIETGNRIIFPAGLRFIKPGFGSGFFGRSPYLLALHLVTQIVLSGVVLQKVELSALENLIAIGAGLANLEPALQPLHPLGLSYFVIVRPLTRKFYIKPEEAAAVSRRTELTQGYDDSNPYCRVWICCNPRASLQRVEKLR